MKNSKTFSLLLMLCSMQAFSQNCGTVDQWEYSATATSATNSDYTVIFDGLSTSNGVKSIHNFIILCNTDTLYSDTACYNTGPSNVGPITDTFTFNAATCFGYQLVLKYSGRTSGACGGTTCLTNVTADNPVAVPVSWLDFRASCLQTEILIQWSTASELNNSGFEIQQFVEDGNWESVGFVAAKEAGNEIQNYSHSVNKELNHTGIYRLKQIDYDGKSDFSKIAHVNCNTMDVVIYPNPAQDVIKFSDEVSNLVISNIHGVEMIVSDDFTQTIDVAELDEGFYFMNYAVNGTVFTKRLSIDRSNN